MARKTKQDYEDAEAIDTSSSIGYVSQLSERTPTAAERRKIKKRRPIGFVIFEDKDDA